MESFTTQSFTTSKRNYLALDISEVLAPRYEICAFAVCTSLVFLAFTTTATMILSRALLQTLRVRQALPIPTISLLPNPRLSTSVLHSIANPSRYRNVPFLVSYYSTTPKSAPSRPAVGPPPHAAESSATQVELGVTQKLKALFRTHGWSALVIYLALSLADFSLTFLLIYAVGADRVREAEDWVLETLGWRRKDGEPGKVKRAVTSRVEGWKERGHIKSGESAAAIAPSKDLLSTTAAETSSATSEVASTSLDSGYSAIATTAALAYAIHKILLLPVRLGLTVAITPRIVRTLQSWGFVLFSFYFFPQSHYNRRFLSYCRWKVGYGAATTSAVKTGAAGARGL